MPIYEYICEKCKNKFELMRPYSQSKESADCPQCHSKSERILSRCYGMTSSESGVPKSIDGGGSSCSSCSAGNCSSCGH